jgi:DNA-binding response OmpR family regulator
MSGPTHPSVLLIEDDSTIGRNLLAGLQAHGYAVTWSRTGSSGLIEATRRVYDVVLLDLGLPDLDGTDVARDLRHRHPDLLIIMLTARGEDIDVVVGLDVGADDYLIKPVGLTVLLARLRAHLRRREAPANGTAPDELVLAVGELTVDTAARRCHLRGVEVVLRPKEFDLLTELALHAGVAVRREDLMAEVWDENWFGSTKTLDVTMAALRRRLEGAAEQAGLPARRAPVITTLRGHGYRLEVLGPHPVARAVPGDGAVADPRPGGSR